MESEKPKVNISDVLARNFEQEQARFLQEQIKFKSGLAIHGLIAAGLLSSLYYILPAARNISKNKENHLKFMASIDRFRGEMVGFVKRKSAIGMEDRILIETEYSPTTPEYQALSKKFDDLVCEFYEVMFSTGFSP